ncbi:MAG: phenylacetic acid degradation bifunctional protein PaaZ, partial [Bdellovibrionales bacterium]|nr:phenylacetic acid degradation bifunctional protein PaaZ [Bdellovibrionales bacterium]
LQHYVLGKWTDSTGNKKELLNAINGELVSTVGAEGADLNEVLNYGRVVGGPALRKMTFHERGRALKALAFYLLERKEKYYKLSAATGATKVDSWIDIEGGIGNLFNYSSKGRRELPDNTFFFEGKPELLSKNGTFIGGHVMVPKEGVALHINAFNFPVWGMLEKVAVNLIAGVPSLVKPASMTAYLTECIFKDIIESKILPEGSMQLFVGNASNIFRYLNCQDTVTFTGSASTGKMLKANEHVINNSVHFNLEADSLNCSILGPDASPGTDDFEIFIKEVAKEMTVKTGQKCTAIRRTIIPEKYAQEVQKALAARLDKTTIGDPSVEGVRMGPLASLDQREEVKQRIKDLSQYAKVVYGGDDEFAIQGANFNKGAFLKPTLLLCENALNENAVHGIEAFGPVSTLMTYNTSEEAIQLAKMGEGSLVGSVVTSNPTFAKEMVVGAACYHGRILVLNKDCAKESTGHGSPLPNLVHGGPGRAGGGEEMGGLRGLNHYMQRTAIQGHPDMITKITDVYQPGATRKESQVHPFRHYFDELEIGQTVTTHKRTITEADIVNFANLSWDHFYAHTDTTSLEGTIFEQRVAHGYFVISAAAGLFVDPGKGPVMANYGLDELRFTKPMYAGDTMWVKLTVKEKVDQEPKEDEKPRGVVKWQVEVFDQDNETCALGTILTLVEKKS